MPLTSVCTATEGALGTPSPDPAFRWEAPVITGTTVTIPGPNTVTVANTLTRDSGTVLVRKQVTGATEGYVNLGTGAQDFTLHGSCIVPAAPAIPRRFADGTIADGGEVPITASIGWTCSGYEDTPSQDLLRDASFAWAPAILTPAGEFTLTRAQPVQVFLAQNPIVRVSSSFSIEKTVVDPNGVVDPAAQYSGTYSCQYGTDAPVTGLWTVGAGETFTVPGILLTSVCTVTENNPDPAAPARRFLDLGGTGHLGAGDGRRRGDGAGHRDQLTAAAVGRPAGDQDRGRHRPERRAAGRHVRRRVELHPGNGPERDDLLGPLHRRRRRHDRAVRRRRSAGAGHLQLHRHRGHPGHPEPA